MKSLKKIYNSTFKDKVLEIVSKIPRGQVLTYKEVAKRAGSPGACRAVGTIMKNNKDPKQVPCHRVIRSDGKAGDYARGGPKRKMEILREEGAPLRGNPNSEARNTKQSN